MIRWTRLERVYQLCVATQVSFSLNYVEASDLWYFEISSAAPSENFIGKDRSFDIAIDVVLEHLDRLKEGTCKPL